MSFRALREGVGVFASKARYGPTPLRCGFGAQIVYRLTGMRQIVKNGLLKPIRSNLARAGVGPHADSAESVSL